MPFNGGFYSSVDSAIMMRRQKAKAERGLLRDNQINKA
jgi:hypothetical protein